MGADGTADSRPAIEFAFREADLRRLKELKQGIKAKLDSLVAAD